MDASASTLNGRIGQCYLLWGLLACLALGHAKRPCFAWFELAGYLFWEQWGHGILFLLLLLFFRIRTTRQSQVTSCAGTLGGAFLGAATGVSLIRAQSVTVIVIEEHGGISWWWWWWCSMPPQTSFLEILFLI